MRSLLAAVVISVLLFNSQPASAVEPGATMFVKPKGTTPLLKSPKKNAKVVAQLECNAEVIWNGAGPDKNYQSVTTADGRKGFVLLEQLSETAIPFAEQGYTKGF